MRADVSEIAGDGRRREHRPVLEVEEKNGNACFCVERVEEAGVGSCEINFAVIHGRGSDDPGAFVGKGPHFFAAGGVDCVEIRIATPEVNDAVSDRRGGLDALLVVSVRVFACFEAPFFCTGDGIECVKVAVPTADEESAIGERGGGMNDVARFEFPLQRAG